MDVQIDFTTLGMVGIIAVCILFGTSRLPQFRENSTKLLKTRIKERDERIEELLSSVKSYKNQYYNLLNKIEREPEVDMQGDLASADGIKAILPSILPALGDYLPKWAQPFMKNPQIAGMFVDFFAKNPKMAMDMLGKFMPKGKSKDGSSQEESPQQSEQFANAEMF